MIIVHTHVADKHCGYASHAVQGQEAVAPTQDMWACGTS